MEAKLPRKELTTNFNIKCRKIIGKVQEVFPVVQGRTIKQNGLSFSYDFVTNPKFVFGVAPHLCLLSSICMMVLRSTTGGLTGLKHI